MTSYLFVTWDGGGNVPPALGIAAELQRRGDRVRVLGHPQQRQAVEAASLAFEPYRVARPWSASAAVGKAGWALKYLRLFTDPTYGREVRDSLHREPADVAVVDGLLLGAIRGAQEAGVRQVTLTHTVPAYSSDTIDRGPVGLVGRLRRLSPADLWRRADLELIATLADLDHGGGTAANARFTGPVWPAGSPAPVPASSEDPAVLVSLSSIFYGGLTRTLRSIMAAVDGLPARIVLTTGHGVAPADIAAPRNVEVHQYLPHAQVMPHVRLVVGHGGHATAMQALAHDLPLVLLPMSSLADQHLVAAAIARQGAATVVKKTASPASIRAAIEAMLADGPHRAAAQRLGKQIRAANGAETAADLLARLM